MPIQGGAKITSHSDIRNAAYSRAQLKPDGTR